MCIAHKVSAFVQYRQACSVRKKTRYAEQDTLDSRGASFGNEVCFLEFFFKCLDALNTFRNLCSKPHKA